MNEEQYQKLNYYLNDIFLMLEEKDSYFLHNIRKFVFVSESYAHFANALTFEEEKTQAFLTFEDVYELGREIIEFLCPCYSEEYSQILSNGILDFSYEKEYDGSHFVVDKEQFEININRQFTYSDIPVLIHEFMHYTNGKKVRGESRHLLTEFISIYFEMKAIIYLVEVKGISPKEVPWNKRLQSTKRDANNFKRYSFPLTMYALFGQINFKFLPKLCDYLSPYRDSEEGFTNECILFLNNMEKHEKSYYKDFTESERNQSNWKKYIYDHTPFSHHYRYILGTLLAFYALEHCETNDMIKLNDAISQYEYSDSNMYEDDEYYYGIENLLYCIGINLKEENTLQESLDSMRHMIEKYSTIKRK